MNQVKGVIVAARFVHEGQQYGLAIPVHDTDEPGIEGDAGTDDWPTVFIDDRKRLALLARMFADLVVSYDESKAMLERGEDPASMARGVPL